MTSDRLTRMPAQCLAYGFKGYEMAGVVPTETTWYKHIAERLESIGVLTFQNHATHISTGMPDKTVLLPGGPIWVEFKGTLGKDGCTARENQVQIARKLNSSTFYRSGKLCCLVYAMPDRLGVLVSRDEMYGICTVDALKNPSVFAAALNAAVHTITKGDNFESQEVAVRCYRLQDLPPKTYRVTEALYAEPVRLRAYSDALAVKCVTGYTISDHVTLPKEERPLATVVPY